VAAIARVGSEMSVDRNVDYTDRGKFSFREDGGTVVA
jgi:hypothetical protein